VIISNRSKNNYDAEFVEMVKKHREQSKT
jgi:hypothetical protein